MYLSIYLSTYLPTYLSIIILIPWKAHDLVPTIAQVSKPSFQTPRRMRPDEGTDGFLSASAGFTQWS